VGYALSLRQIHEFLAATTDNFPTTASFKGIYLMLGAAFFFALTSAISKWLGKEFHIVQLVFFRNIVGVVFIITSVWRRPMRQEGGKLGLLIFRGVVGTLSLYMLFMRFKRWVWAGHLPTSIPIQFFWRYFRGC
jgi:drug/metabolite transporter (DMT)-like permease